MGKPPKKIPSPGPSDGTSTTPRSNPENTSLPGTRVAVDPPDFYWSGTDTTHGMRPPDVSPAQEPAIITTDLPTAERSSPEFPDDMTIYQQQPDNTLMPLGDSGLSRSSEGALYAQIEHVGDVVIQLDAKGQYEIATASPYSVALSKIEGKPLWQKKNHSPHSNETSGNQTVAALRQPISLDELIIANKSARTLAAPDNDGIRAHPSGRLYVDLFNNTTVMVVRTEGGKYQAKDSKSLDTYGPVLERIEGTSQWQPEDSGPGPSKRPRLERPADLAPATAHRAAVSWEPNPHLWLTWGTPAADSTGSIRINELHYKVYDFNSDVDYLAVIKPAELGDTFDDFERMLAETPWLQPVVAFRNTNGQWTVSNTPMFERSPSQSIANAFQDFSDITSADVAHRLFAHSSGPGPGPSSRSLLELSTTLRHWEHRSTEWHSGPTDPLQLLAVTGTESASGNGLLFRSPTDVEKVPRLDFNSEHFAQQWNQFKTRSDAPGLSQLFQTLLVRNGYEVFPPPPDHAVDVLIFRRSHQVYFIKLDISKGQSAPYEFPADLNNPQLLASIGDPGHQALIAAHRSNEVIWLKGGVDLPETGQEATFIIRAPRVQSDSNTVWNGRWHPNEGGTIVPFALIHSRHATKFRTKQSTWIKKNPYYPFVIEENLLPQHQTLLDQSALAKAATSAGNISQKTAMYTQMGMKIDTHALPFFKVPGNVTAEVHTLNGGLIADLVNQKSNGEPTIERIIEPMAGSGFYSNFARAVGFEGEIITNDSNPLISWTQKEMVNQPDRVKHYIDFIKNDLIELGKQHNFNFDSDLTIRFKNKQEARKFIGTEAAPRGTNEVKKLSPEAQQAYANANEFRNTVRNYFNEIIEVVTEIKNGEIIISTPPPRAQILATTHGSDLVLSAPPRAADERAFLAAAFYIAQNSNQNTGNTVAINKLQNGKYTLHFPSNILIIEGSAVKLFVQGLANTNKINYISHLHESAAHPTHFSHEDGWSLLASLRAPHRNKGDMVLLSGHFSDVYLKEKDYMTKIKEHVVPLSNNGAKIIITNSYSEYKETTFNTLGFYTFKQSRHVEGEHLPKAKGDYLLAINRPAMQAAQHPEST
ncbi:hypothetical protein [Pseudomonas fluorescens]|uniref:Uncharacterized protein n=1 Tax=Pseudomonas fluorescens TaxID=294 RepID=A0A5E7DDU5_PSEFL|nr:hypothetical protein [Pseudomonas fluorescens]VVO15473.1 hypothetical protein PS710_03807 [Pseudomonas fluorescens]